LKFYHEINYIKKNYRCLKNVRFKDKYLFIKSKLCILGTTLADVPAGLLNDEDEQNLEMNIDLSKIDRNCILYFVKLCFYLVVFLLVLGCISKRKPVDPLPIKRKRTSSRMNL
jgi:hypothetical protein